MNTTPLFTANHDGYHTYRIPALIVAQNGDLLAFCEGRRHSRHDWGHIDLLCKRSRDGGATWSEPQVVWQDGAHTCGNPCPVLDRQTGVLWLLLTWNRGDDREADIVAGTSRDTRRVFVTHSADHGASWAAPTEITADVKPTDWSWYATGPGVGIQLTHSSHAGRLVIPCDHKVLGQALRYHAHVIYSDDHGASWQLGGISDDGANECQVAELADGALLLNMRRAANVEQPVRFSATSRDGGASWSASRAEPTLIDPRCQGSLICAERTDGSVLFFANLTHTQERRNLTLHISRDEGQSWSPLRTLHEGPAAYSCLTQLPNGQIGCLYEAGEDHPYEAIWFTSFDAV